MKINAVISDWVNQHTDYLLQIALFKTNDQKLAEDLVQDTFISAYEAFKTYKGNSQPRTWLVAILKNKIIDHQRKETRRGVRASLSESGESYFSSSDNWKKSERPTQWDIDDSELLDNIAFQKVLSDCMADLGHNHAAVLKLKYLDNNKSDFICQELDIKTSNYWQLLHRAKTHLRKCLEMKWFKNN
jgi:RNA polymerase sigma-70 factor (ECF subfamily)